MKLEEADIVITKCLNDKKSFFLFAGAGSGKTRSLINALIFVRKNHLNALQKNRKKVAVITYTNAACDEIKHRLEFDTQFQVSTIHSFSWELIKHFQVDIKNWLKRSLENDIKELKEKQKTGRTGQASLDRIEKISRKTERLKNLDNIKHFTYSPIGDNNTKDSLNHVEVIKITSDFLKLPLMQNIMIQKYPIIFVDETQDTNKDLIESLFNVQANYSTKFLIGMFGDTMQRIYSDGKEHLAQSIPNDWEKPSKKINYRCPNRVIQLINKVRSTVDNQLQQPKTGQIDGTVRFFAVKRSAYIDKTVVETAIMKKMSEITQDTNWLSDNFVKKLILEHHMAAKRMGFSNLFEAFYQVDSVRTSLLNGELSGLRFFTSIILPLIRAYRNGDKFEIAKIVKTHATIFLNRKGETKMQLNHLSELNYQISALLALWNGTESPNVLELLNYITKYDLFEIPSTVAFALKKSEASSEIEGNDEVIEAWRKVFACSFDEIERYNDYIFEKDKFGTHQGVKGLEFDRVMVIIDDGEARGFMFKYDNLFADSAIKVDLTAKESSIDRTRRLFYVACSRAKQSLAIVAYADDCAALSNSIFRKQWFTEHEIIQID